MTHTATIYESAEFDKLWSSIKPDGSIGLGTLFYHAKQNGWIDPSIVASATQDAKDILNARLFADANVKRLIFIHETGHLLIFSTAQGWVDAPIGEADRAAKAVVTGIANEAAELFKKDPGGSKTKELVRHTQYSSTLQRVQAMIELAKCEPGMSARLSDFDADPQLLGVLNGVLDLRKMQLQKVQPETLVWKRTKADFEPEAVCPLFDQFLIAVQPDQAVRRLLQQLAGIWLVGKSNLQKLTFFYGLGANGKTTFIEIMAWVLGDYSKKIATEMLMTQQRSSQGPSPDILALKSRRLIFCNEVEEGSRLAEARVKELTGGDTLSARPLYKNEDVTFQPSHKLVMIGNHKPEVRGTDRGIWRRILLIPFDHVIPDEDQDSALLEKLKNEGSGILNWALAGLCDFRKYGLCIPTTISSANDAYRTDQDIIGEWLADHCIVIKNAATNKGALYKVYESWAKSHGHYPLSQSKLTRQLSERGHGQDAGRRNITGLELNGDGSKAVAALFALNPRCL